MAMKGGVLHAFEALQPHERAAAKAGYRFFGFHDVADLISNIGSDPTALEMSDLRYSKSVPDDRALVRQFEKHFEANKSDFAPLSDSDRRAD